MKDTKNLSNEQKEQLSKWLAQGLSLSDVQKQIEAEWDMRVTYMELRFWLDDLELEVAERRDAPGSDQVQPDSEKAPSTKEDALAPTGEVELQVDSLVRPGALVSGSVSFSDGQKAQWQLDQLGRLALNPDQAGYQPSSEDIAAFQAQLQDKLSKRGF